MIILKIDTSFIDWMHKDTGGDVESFCIHYYQLIDDRQLYNQDSYIPSCHDL